MYNYVLQRLCRQFSSRIQHQKVVVEDIEELWYRTRLEVGELA